MQASLCKSMDLQKLFLRLVIFVRQKLHQLCFSSLHADPLHSLVLQTYLGSFIRSSDRDLHQSPLYPNPCRSYWGREVGALPRYTPMPTKSLVVPAGTKTTWTFNRGGHRTTRKSYKKSVVATTAKYLRESTARRWGTYRGSNTHSSTRFEYDSSHILTNAAK